MIICEFFEGVLPPEAAKIREDVFVTEQGFEEEIDGVDEVAVHVLVRDGAVPVATGRLFQEEGDVWHIGRVAVMKNHRGTGIGTVVMNALENAAKERGASSVKLGAQLHAEEFYAKLGYISCGEIHYEENCPHVHMTKMLK